MLDAHHDAHRGAVALVAVADGALHAGDRLEACAEGAGPGADPDAHDTSNGGSSSSSTGSGSSFGGHSGHSGHTHHQEFEAVEVGVLAPEPHPTGALLAGQVGYVVTGLKDVRVRGC